MEKIVLVAHGSPTYESNQFEILVKELSLALKIVSDDIVVAFLKYQKPSLDEAIRGLIQRGAKRVLIVPLFLTKGTHVREDIPRIVENLRRDFPDVQLLLTKSLGESERLVDAVRDLIEKLSFS